MGTIREDLKEKFNNWLDQRCDKGEETYNRTLDDCPDDKYDWRDMLIEELLDGLQYQEKEIKRLNKDLEGKNRILQVFSRQPKPQISPFEVEEIKSYVSKGKSPLTASWKPPYADLDD